MDGMRSVITVVTEGEKLPALMGVKFEGESADDDVVLEKQEDPGDAVLVAPDDEIQEAEIAAPEAADDAGHEVGAAHVLVRPAKDDEIVVNGVTLSVESSLASLCSACSSYGMSTSRKEILWKVAESSKEFGASDNHSRC